MYCILTIVYFIGTVLNRESMKLTNAYSRLKCRDKSEEI